MMKNFFGIIVGIVIANVLSLILQNVLGIPAYAEILTSLFGDQKMMGLLFSLLLIALVILATATHILQYRIKQNNEKSCSDTLCDPCSFPIMPRFYGRFFLLVLS